MNRTKEITVGESPTIKQRTANAILCKWAILGLNQGPPDYESVAKYSELLKKGYPVRNIAKIEGVGISTVMRLKKEFCE